MTTLAFVPNSNTAPPFSAIVTLDGLSYTLSVAWNIYRGDWYYALTANAGTLIINAPLLGSPTGANIPLAPGLFTSTALFYREDTGNFEIWSVSSTGVLS